MTPEGLIKARTKKLLAAHDCISASEVGKTKGGAGWYYMPVQAGLGVKGVPDFIGCYKGKFFSIETKAPGKRPTDLQAMQIDLIRVARGLCFVIDGDAGLEMLGAWLKGE